MGLEEMCDCAEKLINSLTMLVLRHGIKREEGVLAKK
jgi:hypothetical protein